MSTAVKRLTKELRELEDDKIEGLVIELVDDNLSHWRGYIKGNEDSVYSGGIFKFEFEFTNDYPFKPPKFQFKTRVYHPGIDENGHMCIAELRTDKNEWKPGTKMRSVLITIQERLNYPNPEDEPFMHDILNELKTDKPAFDAKAREWVVKYAMEPPAS